MVCYGPSKGCKRCRQRKIKCDERKPDCRNCEKSKRECPGYDRSDGKVAFKHENTYSSTFANRNSTYLSDPLSSTSTSLADEFISLTTHDPTGVTKPVKFTTPNKQPRQRKSSTSVAAALKRVEEQHARDREEQHQNNNVDTVDNHEDLDDANAAGSVTVASHPYTTHDLYSPATADFNVMIVRPDTSPLIVANDFIPLGIPTDPEESSLSFFMSKFAMSADRSEEIWGGFLEALPAVLEKASMKSPLAAAASTTAMASIAWTPGGEGYREEALGKYVTSLKRINEALKDPKQATSDNLLMAVLMLGFYENIKTLTLQRSDREAHIKGAVALIKARKPGSFQSKESIRLFLAVRAQLLSLCIEKGDPTPFEDFNAATQGTLPDTFEPSSADRLVMLSEGIPHLLQREQILLEELDPQTRREKAESLLADSLHLDELLAYWATMMPLEFQFSSIPLPSQHKLQSPYSPKTKLYPENMDIYCDNTMASTWNTWRMTRIRVLRILLHCLEITNPSHTTPSRPPEYNHSINTIYNLLNGICSSVPFHLNFHLDRVGDSSAFTCFPHLPGEAVWPENFASSGAVGGWLMMQPLSFVARCEYTDASMREWVSQYLTTFLRDPRDMGRVIGSPPASAGGGSGGGGGESQGHGS